MRTKLATATRWAAQRPRTNQQGIALQTVIVIVVMLVIAGGVAGVLLSRGSEVIGDLEAADVSAAEVNSQQECVDAGRQLTGIDDLVHGAPTGSAAGVQWTQGSGECVVSSATAAGNFGTGQISQFACEQYRDSDGNRGVHNGATPGIAATTCNI